MAPGAFAKSSPKNLAGRQKTAVSLSWTASAGVTTYEYCFSRVAPTANQTSCDTGWVPVSTSRTASVSSLLRTTTYYWQVRAVNSVSTTYANGGTWWQFTTG